jgi:hypothetical protein
MANLFSGSTLRAAFKYGVPLLFAFAIFMAVGDLLSRSQVAREALAKYPGQMAILVGAAYDGENGAEKRSRYYQLLPNAASPPRLVELTWVDGADAMVHDSGNNWFGFLFSTTIEVIVLVAVYRMWRRDLRARTDSHPG